MTSHSAIAPHSRGTLASFIFLGIHVTFVASAIHLAWIDRITYRETEDH